MTITLRPHQHKAVAAMWDNNKGQVIIPTGGGKTICMIQDAIHQQAVPTGTTTVVVAPRILLAEQLCKEFLELVSTTHTHVMHVHSGDVEFSIPPTLKRFTCSLTLPAQQVRTALSLPRITPCTKFSRQILKSTPFILMKRTILSNVISSLPLNIFLLTLTAAIFSLLLLNTLLPSSNLA